MTKFCNYCFQPLKEVDGGYLCPIHGIVLEEEENEINEESDRKPSYIG